ncbi:nicotinamidase 1 [Selaginella moellendorffii]|nr:nicotinamidase 1 [Selaginella moellendorffii]|eukprot:XP_002976575.2 nicotinamidase 1 [Selaginella moellendorffii]
MDLISWVKAELPVRMEHLCIRIGDDERTGLVVLDEVNGFCTVGHGNLAPRAPDAQVERMVDETVRIAREFRSRHLPVLAFLDCHDPNKPENPYPPHCLVGSGEEELVPDLKWFEDDDEVVLVRKDCINGFVGAMRPDGSNTVVDWINANKIQRILVVGVCTDICVLDFVATMTSVRNHGISPPLEEIVVYAQGCSTYDLPLAVAKEIGAVAHPQDLAHHMGLYLTAARGAKIVDSVQFAAEIHPNGVKKV